ncbi:beta-lactamase family protein [Mycobacterium ulcerans str. Harvey]|uniref:Beta-lactamase family protein n=1 Tax=Mycobacterium ulcerans str. Harvey TaxID=1299332 RepID=A0ABN0RAW0_MYCUL|nr:beta-lactamase family protein [Mycobacterium ulcerans str. Harvey]
MVFSATKGMAATVIHRLADRGLIDYERRRAVLAEFAPRQGEAHRPRGDAARAAVGTARASQEDLLDHVVMESGWRRRSGRLLGKPAYHALTSVG